MGKPAAEACTRAQSDAFSAKGWENSEQRGTCWGQPAQRRYVKDKLESKAAVACNVERMLSLYVINSRSRAQPVQSPRQAQSNRWAAPASACCAPSSPRTCSREQSRANGGEPASMLCTPLHAPDSQPRARSWAQNKKEGQLVCWCACRACCACTAHTCTGNMLVQENVQFKSKQR